LDHSNISRALVHHLAFEQEAGARVFELFKRLYIKPLPADEVTGILDEPHKFTAKELKRFPLKLNRSSTVMRRLDPRIYLLAKEDGLPGQARQ
jgi:hypothetical protein